MSHVIPIRTQDIEAHKFWDVNWADWLVKRGFLKDGSEIVSFAATLLDETTEVVTFEEQVAGTATHRIYIKDGVLGQTIRVRSLITMPIVATFPVTDDFIFKLKGTQQ